MGLTTSRLVRIAPVATGAVAVALCWNMASRWGDETWLVAGSAGAGLGLLSRAFRAQGRLRAARLPLIAVATLATAMTLSVIVNTARPAFEDGRTYWGLGAAVAMASGLPVALAALAMRRRSAGFAIGMGIVAVLGSAGVVTAGALAVVAFLFARDAGALVSGVPARQSIAVVGAGALAILLSYGIAFDLALDLAAAENIDRRPLYIASENALVHWTRIAFEVFGVAACFAHARGRSWGVVGLVVFAIAAIPYLAFVELPSWGTGCVAYRHPLDGPLIWFPLLVALVPWAKPVWRALRHGDLPTSRGRRGRPVTS